MLVNLRQRMAVLLIKQGLFNEAKTEIEKLYKVRMKKEFPIPMVVKEWRESNWYAEAKSYPNNNALYDTYLSYAEELLYSNMPEEIIFIDFVNTHKKMANYITDEDANGFFKYERYFNLLEVGDVLQVRFDNVSSGALNKILTAKRITNETHINKFFKEIQGNVRITEGKSFGFIGEYYIQPDVVSKYKLSDGQLVNAKVIKSFNRSKNQISWKVSSVF